MKQTSKKESENESMAQAVKSLKARPSKLATNPASTFRTSCPSLSDSDRFVSQFRDVEGAFFFLCWGLSHGCPLFDGVAFAAASWLPLVPDSFQQAVGQRLDVGFSPDMFQALQVYNATSFHAESTGLEVCNAAS